MLSVETLRNAIDEIRQIVNELRLPEMQAALRTITEACERAARDIERMPLYGDTHQIQGQVMIAADIAGRLRAALAAAELAWKERL